VAEYESLKGAVTFNVVTIPDGKISDFIDYKIRNGTPEEDV
jgi:hypothetical protein